eukprot:TRINITY_DN2278_c0_g2_i1.p1 TRINITY_DN2278_c0_g2~~TRINITY_DN2278_c0_g2_i1.p1  ORF type:complete len:206 (+),score=61.52 TRINITY_DN2278_c0_g2_i1:65-619(+)
MAESSPTPTTGRVIFISATFLSQDYKQVPESVMRDSLFFFGSKRCWVFPSNAAEEKESKQQPTKYSKFPDDFKQLILDKEAAGLVFWLKPEEDYGLVSQWLTSIDDPVTGEKYKPLILDEEWWKTKFSKGKFTTRKERVVINFKTGDHDYSSVMELLYQSNPTVDPMLQFTGLKEQLANVDVSL